MTQHSDSWDSRSCYCRCGGFSDSKADDIVTAGAAKGVAAAAAEAITVEAVTAVTIQPDDLIEADHAVTVGADDAANWCC